MIAMKSAPARMIAASPLALSQSITADDVRRVDALILARVSGELPLIRDIAQHIIVSGGKRLRPMLTLLSARVCGYEGARHIGLAASVELIHTATLLHDDVVDDSKLRRGLATANDVFGNKASILVGDFLLAQAFQLMVADGSLKTLKILSDAAAVISQGEVKQLLLEGALDTPREAYLEVVTCKTAELFAAACELGAVVADKTAWEKPLRAFGHALGIAFQLVDDALDYGADQQALGKTVGDDFREGKVTLPILLAYAKADASERAFWERTIAQGDQQDADLAQASAILERHHALQETCTIARTYVDRATAAIATLPASPEKQALMEMVEFCVERMY